MLFVYLSFRSKLSNGLTCFFFKTINIKIISNNKIKRITREVLHAGASFVGVVRGERLRDYLENGHQRSPSIIRAQCDRQLRY